MEDEGSDQDYEDPDNYITLSCPSKIVDHNKLKPASSAVAQEPDYVISPLK
jgi:hypothetical protein